MSHRRVDTFRCRPVLPRPTMCKFGARRLRPVGDDPVVRPVAGRRPELQGHQTRVGQPAKGGGDESRRGVRLWGDPGVAVVGEKLGVHLRVSAAVSVLDDPVLDRRLPFEQAPRKIVIQTQLLRLPAQQLVVRRRLWQLSTAT